LISSEHLPAAVSVKVGDIFLDETDSQLKLPITLYGAEFDGTSMQNIDDKNVVAHLSILVVSPSEVTDFFEESES
jgi:inhibitor of KinA sporulation pathway (predicted exonuclease)